MLTKVVHTYDQRGSFLDGSSYSHINLHNFSWRLHAFLCMCLCIVFGFEPNDLL